MKTIKKGLAKLKRVGIDVSILISIGLVLFFLPLRIERQGLELFLYKALLVSAGFVHAHLARKLAFPKVDWTTSKGPYLKILVIALYVTFIFAYSRGG